MNLKEFLKPTKGKVMSFIAVLVMILMLSLWTTRVLGWVSETSLGVPLKALETRGVYCTPWAETLGCSPELSFKVDWLYLVADLLFWYLASCALVFIYGKMRGAKK